jgi:uracil-DNA glycosylase
MKYAVSVFRQHVERWKNGCGSDICSHARRCIARGCVPADILFIGEAPGESENVLGQPFVGPAGHLLDSIIRKAIPHYLVPNKATGSYSYVSTIPYALTNLVCCVPRYEEDGSKATEPDAHDIKSCFPRLQEFATICKPKLIVCVGGLARDWLTTHNLGVTLPNGSSVPRLDIMHPAAILRANVVQKGLLVQRCVVNLQTAVDDYVLAR